MAREGALEDPAVPPDVEGPPKRLPCPRNAPDVAGEGPDPDVGSPETPRAAQNAPGAPDVGQRPPNPDVLHPKIRAGMLLVESDTDVEEEEEADPDVRPSGRRKVPRNVPGAPDVQPETPSPDVVGLKNGRGVLVVESDTDVEEEEEGGIVPDVRPSKGRKAPRNVPGAPDVEVETPNPDVGATKTGRAAQPVGSDTDVEGEEADPDVEPPKRLKMTQNVPGTPDVRRKPPNPDVLRPKIRPRVLLVESDTDVEGEEADPDVRPSKRRKMPRNVPETPDVGRKLPNPDVPGPKSGHRVLLVESDTDVEEDPDVEPKKRLQMTQNVPETPDVQLRTPNPDVPGPKSGCRALLVESDTDVEEEADPDVRTSEGREMTQNVPETPDVGRKLPNPDVSHPKVGRGALLVESDTDVEEDPDVEPPEQLETTQNVPETPDVAAETPSPDVPGPRNGLRAQLVGSDTDVEEDPDVEPPKQLEMTQNVPGTPDVGQKLPNPDVSHPETRARELLVESDTDVEEDPDVEPRKWPKMTQSVPETPDVAAETPSPDVPSPQNGLGAQLVGSDTDVEEDPDVEPPKQLETTQSVPGTPDVGRKLPNPDVSHPKVGRGTLLVESDTDVEEDPDVGASEQLQMTQSVPETPDVAAETPNPDVSGPKMGLLVESDTDVEEDPDVEPPERLQMTQNDPGAPDVGAGSPDPAVEATQLFPGPDPDVEGEEPDPDVRPPERLRMAQNDPGAPDVGPEAPDPDVGSPQRLGVAQTVAGIPDVAGGDSDSDSDPDVAATQLFLPPNPDVGEAEADPDVGRRPERLRRARSAPGIPDVEEEEEEEEGPDPDVATQLFPPPDPDVGPPKRLRTSRGGRGVPDVEEEEEESDPDVATQLFLPPPDVRGAPEGPGIPDVEGPGSPSPDPDVATQLFPPPDPDVEEGEGPPNPDVGGPEGPGRAPSEPGAPDVGAGSPDPDVEEGEGFDVATQLFPAPHPDVEEGQGPPDPDVATQLFPPPGPDVESPKAAAGQPRPPDVQRESPNPDVGGPPGPAHQGEEAPPTPQVRRSLRLAERRGGGASAGPTPAERGRGQAPRPRPSPKPRPQRRRSQSGEGLGEAPPSVPIKGSGRGSEVTPPPQEEEPAGGAKRRLRPRPAPGPAPIRVLFTGLVASPALLVALGTLGGTEATSVHDCSHLVTDGARRTLKLLCALARGVPIVTPEWLLQSSHGGRPLSPAPFLPRCPPLGLRLRPALARARRQPLLQGYGVHVTPSVRPRPEDIRDIVTCCGGTFLPRLPRGPAPRVLVVSCPQDRALWAPAVAAGLPLLSAEQLLAGVLQQRLALPRPPKPPQKPPKPPQKTPQKPPQQKPQKPPQKPPTPPQTPPERPPPQFGSSTPPPSPPRTRSGRRPPQNPPRDPPNSWTPRNPTPNTPKRHQNAPKRPRARSEGPEPFLGGSTPPQSPPRTRSGRRTPQNPPRTPRNPPKKTPSSGTAQKTPNVPQNARKRPRDPPEGDFGVPELPPSPPRTRSRRGPPQTPQ